MKPFCKTIRMTIRQNSEVYRMKKAISVILFQQRHLFCSGKTWGWCKCQFNTQTKVFITKSNKELRPIFEENFRYERNVYMFICRM